MDSVKRRSYTISFILILLSIILIFGITFALLRDNQSHFNAVNFGKVEINDNGTFKTDVNIKDALPGDVILRNFSFSKGIDSGDMYVRAKIYYTTSSQNNDIIKMVTQLNTMYAFDLDTKSTEYVWSENYDNYFYLLNGADNNEAYNIAGNQEIFISDEFRLPLDILVPENIYNESINLHIELQAVQSQGVTADIKNVDKVFGEYFGNSVLEEVNPNSLLISNGLLLNVDETLREATSINIPATYDVVSSTEYEFTFYNDTDLNNTLNQLEKEENLDVFNALYAHLLEVVNTITYPYECTVSIEECVPGDIHNITKIGMGVFASFTNLRRVTLPDTITNIMDQAFYGCTNLQTIQFNGNNLTHIGAQAFTDTAYYNNHPNGLIYLNNWYVGYKGNPTSLICEEDCVGIADGALQYCNFNALVLNSSLKYIGTYSLASCGDIRGSLVIPEGVTVIPDNAFQYTSFSGTLTLPSKLEGIGYAAFRGCGFSGTLNIPDTLKYLRAEAFLGCSFTGELTIPDTITIIQENTFSGCLFNVINLPDNLTTIEYEAFSGNQISSIDFPNTLVEIGYEAFESCSLLKDFTIPSSVEKIGRDVFTYTLWYESQPDGILYKDNWYLDNKNYIYSYTGALNINEGCVGIAGEVFQQCNYTSINFVDTIVYIGEDAFAGCENLTEINLPTGLKYIEDGAFSGCRNITSVHFPSQVEEISAYAFNLVPLQYITVDQANSTYTSRDSMGTECNAVIDVSKNELTLGASKTVIPNTVTSIGYRAFMGRENAIEINIPESVTKIEEQAFDGCGVIKITIPASVTSISDNAFNNCQKLVQVRNLSNQELGGLNYLEGQEIVTDNTPFINTLTNQNDFMIYQVDTKVYVMGYYGDTATDLSDMPSNVTDIYESAFEYNKYVSGDITLNKSLKRVYGEAFRATNITSLTFGDECVIDYFGSAVFNACDKLTTITFNSQMTTIPEYLFSQLSALTTLIFDDNNNITEIGYGAFSYCDSLTNIVLPKGLTILNDDAFGWSWSETKTLVLNSELVNINNAFTMSDFSEVYYLGTKNEYDNIQKGSDISTTNFYFVYFVDGKVNVMNQYEDNITTEIIKSVSYSSDNENVVVDSSGNVTFNNGASSATITATVTFNNDYVLTLDYLATNA